MRDYAQPGHATGPLLGGQQQQQQQQQAPLPKWEKVLWKAQPYPDNYTDATFLQQMVVNADVPRRDFWQVVLGSVAITQQMAVVAAAVAVPAHLRRGSLDADSVLAACAVLLVLGYSVCLLLGRHLLGGSIHRGLRQAALLGGGVYLLSPLLRSLTRTVSEDSVVALSAGLLLLHLLLHDYNFVNSVTDKLTGTLSLGAAMFASVLIAARMPSELDVCAHILLCLELFLLSPLMRRYIRRTSLAAHVGLTAGSAAAGVALLAPLSPLAAVLFCAAIMFVSLVCPRLLVGIQKFKAKINGPWDEAVPHIPGASSVQGRQHHGGDTR